MTTKIDVTKKVVTRTNDEHELLVNAGWVERVVRFLIGLPTATAYFYVRHFNMTWAYAFLAAGLILLIAGLAGDDLGARSAIPSSTKSASAPVPPDYAHAS